MVAETHTFSTFYCPFYPAIDRHADSSLPTLDRPPAGSEDEAEWISDPLKCRGEQQLTDLPAFRQLGMFSFCQMCLFSSNLTHFKGPTQLSMFDIHTVPLVFVPLHCAALAHQSGLYIINTVTKT